MHLKQKRHWLSFWVCLAALFLQTFDADAQDYKKLLKYIQHKSYINEGGCDIFVYEDQTLLIDVASVVVGTKSEVDCKKVAAAKGKRELLSFIQGSEITSFTQLVISEGSEETLEGSKYIATETYVQSIRETVIGTINMVSTLGGWYSGDGMVYYLAIYKPVE